MPVLLARPNAREPLRATAQDGRHDGDGLDIVHRRRAAIEADVRRERRLQPRLALLAFEAFEQRCLFAANVSAGAVVHVDVEIPAMHIVLADELGVVGFLDRALHRLALIDVLAADVDVASVRLHREARDKAAFDQQMRIVAHHVAVFARARLGLVGVDDEIVRPVLHLFRHEGPLQARRKTCAAAAAQAAFLDVGDDPLAAGRDHVGGAVPGAALLRALQVCAVRPVEVEENAILVREHLYLLPNIMKSRSPNQSAPMAGAATYALVSACPHHRRHVNRQPGKPDAQHRVENDRTHLTRPVERLGIERQTRLHPRQLGTRRRIGIGHCCCEGACLRQQQHDHRRTEQRAADDPSDVVGEKEDHPAQRQEHEFGDHAFRDRGFDFRARRLRHQTFSGRPGILTGLASEPS